MSARCSRGIVVASVFPFFITCILATSRVNVYGDLVCLKGSEYVTPKVSDNGHCQNLDNIRSVRPVQLDRDCELTIYSAPDCSSNATLAPLKECGSMSSVSSYSLDCYGPQVDVLQSSLSSTTSKTTKTGTTSSPKPPPDPSTSDTSSSTISTPSVPSSTPSPLPPKPKPSTLTSLISAASSGSSSTLPDSVFPPSVDTYSNIDASRPLTTPLPTSTGVTNSSDRTNLSTAGTIAIGVVIPTISVIVAIIFGVRIWNRGKEK